MLTCLKASIPIPVAPRRPLCLHYASFLPLPRPCSLSLPTSYRPLPQKRHSHPVLAPSPLLRYLSTSRLLSNGSVAATATTTPAPLLPIPIPTPKKFSKKALKANKLKLKHKPTKPLHFTKPPPPQPQPQPFLSPIDAFIAAVEKPKKTALSKETIVTVKKSRDPTSLSISKQSKVKNNKASKSAVTGNSSLVQLTPLILFTSRCLLYQLAFTMMLFIKETHRSPPIFIICSTTTNPGGIVIVIDSSRLSHKDSIQARPKEENQDTTTQERTGAVFSQKNDLNTTRIR